MRNYELGLVIRTEVNEEALNEFLEKIKGWITQAGGSLTKTDLWGKRQLAYPIMKQREGLYVFLNAEMPPAATSELEHNLRLTEQVLRFLIVRQEA
ncbi:MAG: 30S ribosomal protein S6 [Anaerolineales bacterium]|jgi:small subunit ribosomal protein S6